MDNRYIYIFSVITFIFSLSIISVIVFKQLQKYNIAKKDVLLGLSISKVLVNMTRSILVEYGFNEEKVKTLTVIVLKSIDYVINNADGNDLSDDVKVQKAIAITKHLLLELDIVLSVDEENIIEDVVRVGINAVGNSEDT